MALSLEVSPGKGKRLWLQGLEADLDTQTMVHLLSELQQEGLPYMALSLPVITLVLRFLPQNWGKETPDLVEDSLISFLKTIYCSTLNMKS